MTFTAPDVSSLAQSLHRWEIAEYIAEGFVILACAGELVADFGENWLGEKCEKRVERISTMLLVAALSVALICLVRTNEKSGSVIGSLGEKASDAGNKAQSAIDKSSLAENRAIAADTTAGNAQKNADAAGLAASKAQTGAGAVASKAEELEQQLAVTKAQLETVEAKRAELEESLINLAICNAPRFIPFWSISKEVISGPGFFISRPQDDLLPSDVKTAIDPLKPFAGQEAIIEFAPNDAETKRAALYISESLNRAGWKIVKISAIEGIEDGVEIHTYIKRPVELTPDGLREWEKHIRSKEVADALVDFLHSYNWQARVGRTPEGASDIPPDGIKIRVGLYPPVIYVSPPGAKEFDAATARWEQERKRLKFRWEDERLKALTPQQATEYKARRQKWAEDRDKEEKLGMERRFGPCQTFSGFPQSGNSFVITSPSR